MSEFLPADTSPEAWEMQNEAYRRMGGTARLAVALRLTQFARETALVLHTPRLRIYANDDLVGVEVGGAVKNVMAIATGICDGLGLGLNARAALITRGLAEISRLGVAMGAQRETLMGLAGMGDLILTCTGDLSRNRRVGLALASGKSVEEALMSLGGEVAEGVSTAGAIVELAQSVEVVMPISETVTSILSGATSPREAVGRLMTRSLKEEGMRAISL